MKYIFLFILYVIKKSIICHEIKVVYVPKLDLTVQADWITKGFSETGGEKVCCSFECSKHDVCRAFLLENDRCVLIGDSTLFGDDVSIEELAPVMFYYSTYE